VTERTYAYVEAVIDARPSALRARARLADGRCVMLDVPEGASHRHPTGQRVALKLTPDGQVAGWHPRR
jgi:hypothetical protein